MPMRWGMGPVFVYESMLGARRWQVYALRALLVAVLLTGMTVVWVSRDGLFSPGPVRRPGPTFRQMAEVGKGFFFALAGIQLSLVMLAAPAAAAGSICTDRLRGTLLHMMVTDLSDVEIVLGKLGSRLAPVLALIVGAVPVTALVALLGGIDFGALLGAFVVSVSLAVLGCALALAISVRATKTHEVLMAVYVLEGLGLLALPIWWGLSQGTTILAPPEWFQKANPYVLVFAPYSSPGFAGPVDFVAFVAVAFGVSAVLVGLTIARLRRAVIDQAGRAEESRRRGRSLWERVFPSWPGPSLDGNPVLWREWHRNRPSRLARRLWGGLFVCTWGLAAWGTVMAAAQGLNHGPNALVFGFAIQVAFGLLMLSATAPTSLAEERARGSLDVVMATPLSTGSIVLGKWWGAYRRVLLLAVLPLFTASFVAATAPDVPAYALAWRLPQPRALPLTVADRMLGASLCVADFLASGAALVSLGLALATWVRRLGRAVALSVIAYFLVGMGWPFLVEMLWSWVRYALSYRTESWHRWVEMALISLSPFGGPMNSLESVMQAVTEPRTFMWSSLLAVVLFKLWVAGVLYSLTVRTFDRCLGRVPAPRILEGTRALPRPAPRDRMSAHATARSPTETPS